GKAESEEKINRLECRIKELTEGLAEAHTKGEENEKKNSALVTEIATLQQTNSSLEGKQCDLNCALVASSTKCERLTKELTLCTARVEGLEATSNTIRLERDDVLQKTQSLQRENKTLATKAESYKLQVDKGEKLKTTLQGDVVRLEADKTRLESNNHDLKVHHKQETDDLKEKLGKASKELLELKSRPKSNNNQPVKPAVIKNLEAEIARLQASLEQTEKEKNGSLEAEEASSKKIKTLEEQLKQVKEDEEAAREEISKVVKDASEQNLRRKDEEDTLRLAIEREQADKWAAFYKDILKGEKFKADVELEKAKAEKDALAKKVEALTSGSPSGQVAKSSFNTIPTNPTQADLQDLHNLLAKTTNDYEAALADSKVKIKYQSVEMLPCLFAQPAH
ncbi:MAG: hypothetical protein Q9224_005983, partial [Gallowayella concinna]